MYPKDRICRCSAKLEAGKSTSARGSLQGHGIHHSRYELLPNYNGKGLSEAIRPRGLMHLHGTTREAVAETSLSLTGISLPPKQRQTGQNNFTSPQNYRFTPMVERRTAGMYRNPIFQTPAITVPGCGCIQVRLGSTFRPPQDLRKSYHSTKTSKS